MIASEAKYTKYLNCFSSLVAIIPISGAIFFYFF
jgi:hypothetical protein